MKTWTLALDESGSFEGAFIAGEREESVATVVGGVLLPGTASETRAKLRPFKDWCAQALWWPPHAKDFTDDDRDLLVATAGIHIRELGGLWIFLEQDPPPRQDPGAAVGRFVRMFGATVDLAARIVASLGGEVLDIRPAARAVPLRGAVADIATQKGVAGTEVTHSGRVRAMLWAEARHALDALNREPAGQLPAWPELGSVEVAMAGHEETHPGIALADAGCNQIRGRLRRRLGGSLEDLVGQFWSQPPQLPPVVVPLPALPSVRGLDRSLRAQTPDLVGAARHLAALEGDAQGQGRSISVYAGLRAGAAGCARELWERGVAHLAKDGHPLSAMAAVLAPRVEVDLIEKTGAYEGTWLALYAGWAGNGALARAVRAGVADRVQAARLWRLTLECANHRGDVTAADQAIAAFDKLLCGGRSYLLLAEELLVRNLAVVALQNRLPASVDESAALLAELERRAHLLADAADVAGDVVARMAAVEEVPHPAASPTEMILWGAIGEREVARLSPDRERGMAYGTVARCFGFCSQPDQALRWALKARALFADSARDLTFNAAVIARLELDRVRCDPGQLRDRRAFLDAALDLAGARRLFDGKDVASTLARNPAMRFALDLALRALLWAPAPGPGSTPELVKMLSAPATNDLLDTLSRAELRTHPTELIARHAGELIRRYRGSAAASDAWFKLAGDICKESAPGSTLRRLDAFTTRLADDPRFISEGPAGSLFNPTFEYR